MILPPYLRSLGYDSIPVFKKLDKLSYEHKEDHIQPVYPWAEIRDILEYLSCVEFSKGRILELPTGRALGSKNVIPARYDSASLVFFAQATLDNLAVWLNDFFELNLNGTNRFFYKNKIKSALSTQHAEFGELLNENEEFIQKLNSYRMEWLHRIAGGAQIYSDKSPSGPDANISIEVPIDPEIPGLSSESQKYIKRIQKVQTKNDGKWLMSIEDFATYIQSNTKELLIRLLEEAVTARVA
jgi:hypothetical protein